MTAKSNMLFSWFSPRKKTSNNQHTRTTIKAIIIEFIYLLITGKANNPKPLIDPSPQLHTVLNKITNDTL